MSTALVSVIAGCIFCSCLTTPRESDVRRTSMRVDSCYSVVIQERVQAQMRGQRPPEGM